MEIQISLTSDEAFVLLAWLHAHDEADDLPHDEAEQRVLWNLEPSLESVVEDAFAPDHAARLEAAKRRLTAE